MLDVRRLRLLRELALRGTIAAVAEALAFTPSAVSQQLSTLEREAGLPLLERSGRRVSLTPAGLALVRHAEVVLERLEQAAAELADARQGLAGPLRVGTFPTATRAIVLAALDHLARRHPALEPMVTEYDPADVAPAVRAGELDVALVHVYDFVPPPDEPGLATEPLCSEAMFLASPAPASGRRAGGGPPGAGGGPGRPPTLRGGSAAHGRLEPWADAPWITGTAGTLCREMTLRACQAAGFTPRVRHRVDDFGTVLALVGAGHGVALVPELAAMDPPPGVVLGRTETFRHTRIAFRAGAAGHPAVVAVGQALRMAVPEALPPRPRG